MTGAGPETETEAPPEITGEGPELAEREHGTENYLTPKERQAINDYVPFLGLRKWRAVDVQWALQIAYWGALRIDEVPRLRERSFDFTRRTIYIPGRTKNRSNVRPFPASAVAPLRVFWEERRRDMGDVPLLPGCSTDRFYRWLKKIGAALLIPAFTSPQATTGEKTVCHAFRKSAAKDMLWGTHGKKATIDQVQAQLGHSNPIMTGRYLRMGGEAADTFWGDVEERERAKAKAAVLAARAAKAEAKAEAGKAAEQGGAAEK